MGAEPIIERTATLPLGLTMGDPAGIGLEISLKAWLRRDELSLSPFCIYGSADALADRAQQLNLEAFPIVVDAPSEAASVFARGVPVIDIPLQVKAHAGRPEARNARSIIAAIDRAVGDVQASKIRAVVTNPIAKSVLHEGGFRHPGHTEYLAELAAMHWDGGPFHAVMMISSNELKVVPLTIHVPLSLVPQSVTRELITKTVVVTHAALIRDFGIASPRLAISGLNPHAGESGLIGTEDRDIIAPAVEALVAQGYNITGPLPADTMFHAAARSNYDAAICMYHDQALIPIKTLAFDTGVNVTLGLPFVRTSPDHGTAFDIAARGIASPESLIEALKLSDSMTRRHALAQP